MKIPTFTTQRQRGAGFTLLELLVSLTVLSLLMVLVFSMVAKTQETWEKAETRVSQFREARNAFEQVTRRVSQALLGTYWDYEYQGSSRLTPSAYGRQSDLHFICGPMSDLPSISGGGEYVTHGIFFQAPLGYSEDRQLRGRTFDALLNACGYFVEYNSDAAYKPTFVRDISPERLRYRLMEFLPPSEELDVYQSRLSDASNPREACAWWTQNVTRETNASGFFSRPIAENIIALVLRPKKSKNEDGIPTDIAPDYIYDSREGQYGSPNDATLHQLPPTIEITMVAVAERSMIRYVQINGDAQPDWTGDLFKSGSRDPTFLADLEALKSTLTLNNIDFRVFSETVAIRASKWSDEDINR